MSNGKKSDQSPSRSKRKPTPPKGYEIWFKEYVAYTKEARKAEARGQYDTYYHDNLPRLLEAFEFYGLEIPEVD